MANTFGALTKTKTAWQKTKNLEHYVILLQIWFLEHIILGQPLSIKEYIEHGLMKENIKISSREIKKREIKKNRRKL